MKFLLALLLLASTAFARELYSIHETAINGASFNTQTLKGKTVLFVNIASQCGYTPQLNGLEALYNKYKNKNFIIIGVPTNDFGGQTPEDDKEMLEFCQKNYQVTFPILTKKTVKGKEKRELYKFLTEETPSGIKGEIGWNFEKFLVDKNGKVIARFGSSTKPDDSELIKKIESAL